MLCALVLVASALREDRPVAGDRHGPQLPPREYRSPNGGLAEEFASVEGFEIPPGEHLHLIFAVRRAAGHDRLGHRPRFAGVALAYDYFGRRSTTTLRDGVALCPPGRC